MWALILDLSVKTPESVSTVAGQMTNTSYVGNILIGLILVVMVLVYGFLLDPHNILINLLSMYVGLAVTQIFPFASWNIFDLPLWLGQLVFFSAVAILMAMVLSLTHLFKIIYVRNFFTRWFSAIVTAFLHSGFLASIILVFLPASFLSQFSPWVLSVFASEKARFWWAILPMVALFFLRHKTKAGRPPAY